MFSAIKHILRSQRKSKGWWLRPSNCHARCCSLCCWFGSFEVEKWTYGSSSNGGSWHSPIHGAGTDGGPKIQLQSRHLFIRDHPVWNFDSVFYRYGEDPITDEFTQIRVPEEFCCTVSCRGMKFTESKKKMIENTKQNWRKLILKNVMILFSMNFWSWCWTTTQRNVPPLWGSKQGSRSAMTNTWAKTARFLQTKSGILNFHR